MNNQIKSNQIKSNQIKSNQIKSNQIKSNQIKSNQITPHNLDCIRSTNYSYRLRLGTLNHQKEGGLRTNACRRTYMYTRTST
jgi:hypothetical protein